MTTRSVRRSGERKRHRVGGRRLEYLHAKDERTPPLRQDDLALVVSAELVRRDEVVGKRLAVQDDRFYALGNVGLEFEGRRPNHRLLLEELW
ncbi:MAG: hypothetical protein KAU10_08200, partial [Dehalococcoidia bacterium]|nr:hypothetical protein [Dehalococcoidia bacterium]